MSVTSLRALYLGKPSSNAEVDTLTFAADAAVSAWITAQGITPYYNGHPLVVWSTAILTADTAHWQAAGFFTEGELLQWQAQVQAAKTAKTAYASAASTHATQIATTATAQQALDASPLDSGLQTALASAIATLATDAAAATAALRTYADAIKLMLQPTLLNVPNPFYNAADWDAIAINFV